MVFQKKGVCWKFFKATAWGGLPNFIESTMERSGLPLHFQES